MLYIELQQGGAAWKAYYGARNRDKATLNQVVGPGSATLELTFISTVKVEAHYFILWELNFSEISQTVCAIVPKAMYSSIVFLL